MNQYRILFLGDIVGKPGRQAVKEALPSLLESYAPLFTIVNGENSAGGVGITPEIAEELYAQGVDAITLGNHAYNKREIYPYLNLDKPIVRPANYPKTAPGKGLVKIEKQGVKLSVANLMGRVFIDGVDDPFAAAHEILEQAKNTHLFLDFHAEATSEKIAMGFLMAGRAVAVVGTHTHVTTADEQILEGGTAYITDVGMCGPWPSVLGMDRDIILQKFQTSMPAKFEVASTPGIVHGVIIDVETETGHAVQIERIRFEP